MSRHALIIGLNCYQHLKSLRLPADDAEAIARLLEAHGDFKITRLPEFVTPDQRLIVAPDAPMTAAQLKKAIAELFTPKGSDTPTTALLFFAGHGIREEVGVIEGYLATSDTDKKQVWGLPSLSKSPILL
jgi:uncharacterized caspase-like protein